MAFDTLVDHISKLWPFLAAAGGVVVAGGKWALNRQDERRTAKQARLDKAEQIADAALETARSQVDLAQAARVQDIQRELERCHDESTRLAAALAASQAAYIRYQAESIERFRRAAEARVKREAEATALRTDNEILTRAVRRQAGEPDRPDN